MLAILKELCAANNTNFSRVEKAIGIGNGQLARWGKSSPSIESASKVADFFKNANENANESQEGQ